MEDPNKIDPSVFGGSSMKYEYTKRIRLTPEVLKKTENAILKFTNDDKEKINNWYKMVQKKVMSPNSFYDWTKVPYTPLTPKKSQWEDIDWSTWGDLSEVKDIIEKVIELEKRKSEGKPFSVALPGTGLAGVCGLCPDPHRGYTAGEHAVIYHAVKSFNSHIPREGQLVRWGPLDQEQGVLWGLEWKENSYLIARITPHAEMTPPTIKMNGVRRIKKSERVLSDLVIERLFVEDDFGSEITLISVL